MVIRDDEAALTADIIRLASEYGRYGYRRITALLRREGWTVNFKRVERIWRREGLKVPQNSLNPQKQPKRGRFLIKRWRHHYNTIRPHSSLGYKPPAPETVLPRPVGLTYTSFRSGQQGGP